MRRYPLPDGDAGIARTIHFMRGAAMGNEGARNPHIRAVAVHTVEDVPNRDARGEVRAIFNAVQKSIAFRGEKGELVQTPVVTLHLCAGDCDDHSVLLAALLQALGHKTRFVTVAADPEDPNTFTHVYVEVYDRASGQWMPLDTTQAGAQPGWAPDRITRIKQWQPMGGLGVAPAASQLSPTGSLVYDLANRFAGPLVDAYAQKTAYPSGALLFGSGQNVGFSTGMSANFPWAWVLLIGGGLLLYSRGRR